MSHQTLPKEVQAIIELEDTYIVVPVSARKTMAQKLKDTGLVILAYIASIILILSIVHQLGYVNISTKTTESNVTEYPIFLHFILVMTIVITILATIFFTIPYLGKSFKGKSYFLITPNRLIACHPKEMIIWSWKICTGQIEKAIRLGSLGTLFIQLKTGKMVAVNNKNNNTNRLKKRFVHDTIPLVGIQHTDQVKEQLLDHISKANR